MTSPYVYRLSGRRPATVFGLLICLVFAGVALAFAAPWYALLPPIAAAAMMLTAIVFNPQYGLRIDRTELAFDRNGDVKRFALCTIDHVQITKWTDSDDVIVHLHSGERYPVPQMTRPEITKLRDVLTAHGVAVKTG